MSINSNIEDVIKLIKTPGNASMGDDIQREAIKAIQNGQGSAEWKTYMKRFAKTTEQLARLNAEDETNGDFFFDVARTYLIGNGTCGAATVDDMDYGVDDKLDEGLPADQTPL